MLRVLIAVAIFVFMLYCLVEAWNSPPGEARGLSKGWWMLIILFFPVLGGIAWLTIGRPLPDKVGPAVQGAPDDDAEFLHRLREQRLRQKLEKELEEERRKNRQGKTDDTEDS